MSMTAGAARTAASALPRRWDPSASTPSARSALPSAMVTIRLAWGRKAYAAGTPSGLTIVTRLPSASHPSPSASKDPSASPSGRTWQAIRRLFAFRISLAACFSSSGLMVLALPHAVEQRVDPRAAFDGGIGAKLQSWDVSEGRAAGKLAADETGGALEAL